MKCAFDSTDEVGILIARIEKLSKGFRSSRGEA